MENLEYEKSRNVWRVDQVDNLDRPEVADHALLHHLTFDQATRICEILRENSTETGSNWYEVRHRSKPLYRGEVG